MRRYIKKKAFNWIATMHRAHEAILKLVAERRLELAFNLLTEMQKGAISIGNMIDATGEADAVVREMEQFCEIVYVISERMQMENVALECAGLKKQIELIERKLRTEVKDSKLEVVILPYKSSMWDSLESIWKAASEDEECNVKVIPIPYYSRNPAFELDEMYYEGKNFPEYVPITDYHEVNLEELHPDVIFFHNPFDGNNRVTSVDPAFYSSQLKTLTGLLVYVPYTLALAYEDVLSAVTSWCKTPGAINSDKIVVQSEGHKEMFLKAGTPESKILLLGSPKIDACLQCMNEKVEKEEGVTTFLLNSTIAHLLRVNEKWFDYMEELLDLFVQDKSLKLIWRPHPLLEDTVRSMRVGMLKRYKALLEKVEALDNVVIDNNPDTYASFRVSDALITDESSLMLMYVATGKPVLNVEGSASDKEKMLVAFDYFSNYFVNDGMTYEKFIAMVKEGRDEKKEERWNAMVSSVVNCDGTIGQKVYDECKRLMDNL